MPMSKEIIIYMIVPRVCRSDSVSAVMSYTWQ